MSQRVPTLGSETHVPPENARSVSTEHSEVTLPAKHPKTLLAGPYGHPFHPILVTVPIGAWIASLVFEVAALASEREATFAEGAYWLIIIGIIGAAVAALFGLLDLMTIPSGTLARRTALTHMAINTAVLVLFVITALSWPDGRDAVTGTQVTLTVVGLLALSVSGWLGGKLSYHYGVRVADEQTQASGFRA
jgi:uncharacterized membrane protein